MPVLYTLACSTRPGRVAPVIARWFHGLAAAHGGFDARLLDLGELALPMMDEPRHPRLAQYTQPHTRAWSATVAGADAFVFVTPEYNYAAPAPLVNAIDYLFHEWAYKPVGFVSYGGLSGGTRSVQMTKQIVTTLKMMPLTEAVVIPMFHQQLKDGSFVASQAQEDAAQLMLDELLRWTEALQPLRGARERAAGAPRPAPSAERGASPPGTRH